VLHIQITSTLLFLVYCHWFSCSEIHRVS